MKSLLVSLILLVSLFTYAYCQVLPEPQIHLEFWPNYHLPGMANSIPGNYREAPKSRFEQFKQKQQGFMFMGQAPTEVLENIIPPENLPTENFSYEFLLLHHVHTPLGFAAYFFDEKTNNPNVLLTYYKDKEAMISTQLSGNHIEIPVAPYQKRWYHCVLTYEKDELIVYVNGEELARKTISEKPAPSSRLYLALYAQESYLKLVNTIKDLKVYAQVLNSDQVQESFQQTKEKIAKGSRYKDLFHFLAGPYLHKSDTQGVNILWEVNMPANATIEYGTQLPLTEKIEVEEMNPSEKGYEAYIQEISLEDLKPHHKYFYNIKVRNYEGDEMESGILSFQTAVESHESFQFAAIGDTETRPHINDRIAKQVWGERPDFVLHMGDLTDGGDKDSKWEWNYEYFEGMSQLHARIPVFPVPGNGEGEELYWYKKYHRLGEEEAFYSFSYGNSEFFMMNSVARKEEFQKGGRQYQWLEQQLGKSKATWKFVCLHHAPYSTDENDYGNSYEAQGNLGDNYAKALVPLFEEFEVDIVFFGHLHSYSRMGPIAAEKIDKQKGVWYIQTGGAGGNLENFGPSRAWFSEKTYAGHHYCIINIFDKHLRFKMYDLEGRLRDFMEINK